MLSFDTVKLILSDCVREELRDHAFGDAEVFWSKNGKEIAEGYFGGGGASVWLPGPGQSTLATFSDMEARHLRQCGTTGHIERNDETGPKTYQEGKIMDSLTKEAVYYEITRRN